MERIDIILHARLSETEGYYDLFAEIPRFASQVHTGTFTKEQILDLFFLTNIQLCFANGRKTCTDDKYPLNKYPRVGMNFKVDFSEV